MSKTATFFAYLVIAVFGCLFVVLAIAAVAFGLILLVPVGLIGGTKALVDWIRERRAVKNIDQELRDLING